MKALIDQLIALRLYGMAACAEALLAARVGRQKRLRIRTTSDEVGLFRTKSFWISRLEVIGGPIEAGIG